VLKGKGGKFLFLLMAQKKNGEEAENKETH
jgi:hypothetical protein